jgi:hypothetical protein
MLKSGTLSDEEPRTIPALAAAPWAIALNRGLGRDLTQPGISHPIPSTFYAGI